MVSAKEGVGIKELRWAIGQAVNLKSPLELRQMKKKNASTFGALSLGMVSPEALAIADAKEAKDESILNCNRRFIEGEACELKRNLDDSEDTDVTGSRSNF